MNTVEWYTNKKANPKGLCKAVSELFKLAFCYLLKEADEACEQAKPLETDVPGSFNTGGAYFVGGYLFKMFYSLNMQLNSDLLAQKKRDKEYYQKIAKRILHLHGIYINLKKIVSPLVEDHPFIQMLFSFCTLIEKMIEDKILTAGFFVKK